MHQCLTRLFPKTKSETNETVWGKRWDDGTWHPDENISSDHCAERKSDLKHAHLNTIIFKPDRVIIAAVFNYSSHWASLGCTCVLCVWVRKILNYKSGQSYLRAWQGEGRKGWKKYNFKLFPLEDAQRICSSIFHSVSLWHEWLKWVGVGLPQTD